MYDKTNDDLVHDIYSNWQSRFTLDKSVNELWDDFKSMYQDILSCVPRRRFCLRKGSRHLHNPLFKELVKEKHRLWLVLSNTPSTSIWASYKHARNSVSRLAIQLRPKFEWEFTYQLNSPKSIKTFFRYAKHQRSDIENRISLIDTNGMLAPEERIANLFADHFSSVYNEPVERGVHSSPCIEVTKCLSEVAISEETVLQQLELLNVNKSPCPDRIHPKLFKKYSSILCKPLYYIFTVSMRTGILPDDWKLGDAIPLHKKRITSPR